MHVGSVLGVEYNHVEEGLLEEVEVVSWALKNEEEFTRQISKQGADIDFRNTRLAHDAFLKVLRQEEGTQ